MRVALIGAETEENLGLRYLAASLAAAGHRAEVIAFDGPDRIRAVAEEVAESDYDVVGLSMMFQLRAREFVSVADWIRGAGFRGVLVAGGQHATFMAREILEGCAAIDAIVLGDGEGPMTELVERLAGGGDLAEALAAVPGLWVRRPDGTVSSTGKREGRTDLHTLPNPVRDARPRRHMGLGVAPMIASRGCYARCTFCSIIAWEKLSGGPRLRQRPAEHVAEEMADLYHRRGVRIFNFHDDNFWLPTAKANHERLTALERALRARGVGDVALLFKCRPNDVDRDLMARARDLGMVRVYVGVETDAPAGLVTLRRGVSQEQNQRALDVLASLDVHVCSNLLVFDPDTRLEDLAHNIDFIERNAHHTLNFCRVEAYGGTPLTKRLEHEGRLRGDYLGFDYTMREPRVELLWRIVHLAFHERNFPADGLANDVIALAYRFHLAKRFWPGPALEGLRAPVEAFVRCFNASQVRFLCQALAYAERASLDDRADAVDYAVELAAEVREEDGRLRLEHDVLVARLEGHAAAHGAGGSRGLLGEGAAGSGWWHASRSLALSAVLTAAACGPAPGTTTSGAGGGAGGSGGEVTTAQPNARGAPADQSAQAGHGAGADDPTLHDDAAPDASLPPPSGSPVDRAAISRAQEDLFLDAQEVAADPTLASAIARATQRAEWHPPVATTDLHALHVEVQIMGVSPPRGPCGFGSPGAPYLDVHVTAKGAHASKYLLRHVAVPGGQVQHVVLDEDGRGAYVRVALDRSVPPGRHDAVAVYETADGSTRIVATAPFAILPNLGFRIGPDTTVARATRMRPGCDPVPMPTPPRVAYNTDPTVHIGTQQSYYGGGLTPPDTMTLLTWLDDDVRGDVGDVTASVDTGQVQVSHTPGTRVANLTYDPRGNDLRPVPGRHTITVRWQVTVRGRTRTLEGRLTVRVRDDGNFEAPVAPPPHAMLEGDPLPLGERFGARIDARRAHRDWELAFDSVLTRDGGAIDWRTSSGAITPEPGSLRARFTPDGVTDRPVVVATLRVADRSIAVASWSPA